jgi:uncharacterized protein YbgA (DUF1722 family)
MTGLLKRVILLVVFSFVNAHAEGTPKSNLKKGYRELFCRVGMTLQGQWNQKSKRMISRYRQEFDSSLESRKVVAVAKGEVFNSLINSQFMFVSDFHLTRGSKDVLLEVMEKTTEKNQEVTLVIEFISRRNQKWIDDYLSGKTVLREIPQGIINEWDYDFRMYLPILARAKELKMKVLAVDPRGSEAHRRDAVTAATLARAAAKNPKMKFIVYLGDLHLAGNRHIPNLLDRAGLKSQTVIVNMPAYHYFRALKTIPNARRHQFYQISSRVFEMLNESPVVQKIAELAYVEGEEKPDVESMRDSDVDNVLNKEDP